MSPASTPTPTLCPQCSRAVESDWHVCPACLTRLPHAPQELPTETLFSQAASVSSSTSADEGRFPAGTVLAGRYRVLGLLGKGGMGEVYRAFDLILNQSVALKFLTQTRFNEAALARFRNEVRIARQVSHPNVCRVYDIGYVDGLHFLSMEYLDGEDLGSLLRRIGRLPADKAIEFTRKICAGLSAAHERGVLHRDLKPGNIMIDGRGHVRITDFGLAALAEEIALGDIRSGTPAYMSPEQKAGKEVTVRSDIYALGLVIHEMFTGKRRAESSSSPSELVKDLDPAIERVILRCLEEEPRRRPQSALNVAMAMPGGDPIAAALAAGETPSPEMVAASQEKEGLRPPVAIVCFVVMLLAMIAMSVISGRLSLLARAPLDQPPDVLAFRAQTILEQLGYPEKPRDTAYGFGCCNVAFLNYLQTLDSTRRDELLASHQPAVTRFWYRQHSSEIQADSFITNSSSNPGMALDGVVTYDLPANIEPGMIRMELDPRGRLTALEVRPVNRQANSTAVDWGQLFQAAGLDAARFTPTDPQSIPAMAVDQRAAWLGTYGNGLDQKVRVEAAAWQGRAVSFQIVSQLNEPVSVVFPLPGGGGTLAAIGALLVIVSLLVARRNLRLGRGDRHGAAVIASIAFTVLMLRWLIFADHVAEVWELALFAKGLCFAGFFAAVLWTFYLSIEPPVRRIWPDALISWSRLQSGRFRDPLVASHILIGLACGLGLEALSMGWGWLIGGGDAIYVPRIDALSSPAYLAASVLFEIPRAVSAGLGALLLLILARAVVRNIWIACILVAAVEGRTAFVAWVGLQPVSIAWGFLAFLFLLAFVVRRFGALAFFIAIFAHFASPLPVSLGGWYNSQSLMLPALYVVVGSWALAKIMSSSRRSPSPLQ